MNKDQANKLVENELSLYANGCRVIPEYTKEFNKCFAVFYQGKDCLDSGKQELMLVGHGPVLVDKETSTIQETGSAHSTEHYVRVFESCGDPFARLTGNLKIYEWVEGAKAVIAIKEIKRITGSGLQISKEIVDQVLNGVSNVVECESIEAAEVLKIQLKKCGFNSKILWSNECCQKIQVL